MGRKSSGIRAVAIGLCLLAPRVAADTLPLPQNLLDFTSEAGADLFIHAEARAAYWPLAAQFISQENPAFCGIASLVMVMNALRVLPPAAKEMSPFAAFTQSNFLSDATEKILPRAVLLKQGMTLLCGVILKTSGRHHVDESLLKETNLHERDNRLL